MRYVQHVSNFTDKANANHKHSNHVPALAEQIKQSASSATATESESERGDSDSISFDVPINPKHTAARYMKQ